MADNVVAGAAVGTGPTFRTDDLGAPGHVPYAKLMDGADGGTAGIPGDATNGLFVNVKTAVLPTGAATSAAQTTANASLATLAGAVAGTEVQVDIVASAAIPVTDNSGNLSVDDGGGSLTVDGTVTANAGSGTFAISAAALPLPSGAATAAKQPALGTAGTASADVISVQGIASMTPLLVNGSGVTQPVSDAGGSLTTDTPQLPAALVGGRLDVVVGAALPAGANAIGTVTAVGAAAHDAAISGNPVRVGGRAVAADVTAVTAGDAVDLIADLNGKQIILPYAIPENMEYGVTAAITGTSVAEILAAAAAGIRHYVTSLTVINSHATVGTVVEIRDGTTTVIHRGYAAPVGGGYSVSFPVPLRGTAATALNAYNITNGSNVYVSASGYKAP